MIPAPGRVAKDRLPRPCGFGHHGGMTPHPDRLALLRAVAADPDDDTPRLVYADWLDEHGTGDADRARAEFLRVACNLKAKARFAPAEGKWLDANWERLLPAVAARLADRNPATFGFARPTRSGRYLTIYTSFDEETDEAPDGTLYVRLEVWRGFVRRAVYGRGFGLIAAALAADEPLAWHEGEWEPVSVLGPDGRPRYEVALYCCCGSPAVWDRLAGADGADDARRVKWFRPARRTADPDAQAARIREAVAAAMTAEARHRAGWPEDFPTLGR
jgi:uncharacterized protein (TIGR02996 family)